MRNILAFPRSLVFAVIFYGATFFWVLVAFAAARFSREALFSVVRGWSMFHRFCARWITGQRVVWEGERPETAMFYVLKHESMFETIDLPFIFAVPMIAAKKELLEIPLWGPLARLYGLLPVDREAGATALRQLRRDARAAMAAGRPLCLFPEGTRVGVGETPPLKSGFAGLYAMLKEPVVPIAVSSGTLNPNGFMRYPGKIRYRVGPTVPPGLEREEVEARVHAALNAFNDTTL